MPLFEYECLNCGHVFEMIVNRAESGADQTCPTCGKTNVERLWSPFSGRSGKGGSCGNTSVPGFR